MFFKRKVARKINPYKNAEIFVRNANILQIYSQKTVKIAKIASNTHGRKAMKSQQSRSLP